jgi:hypothetical protein
MTHCYVGWIDSFGYLDDGPAPETQRGLSLYYKEQAEEKYKDLVDAGLSVEVDFDHIDAVEADITVHVRWRTSSLATFAENVAAAICHIPDGHAYGVQVGSLEFTEDDFELAGELLPATRARLADLFPASDDSITSDLFWDCNCLENYIHAYAVGNRCLFCGAFEHEMPDSHKSELHQYRFDCDCAEHVEVTEA